MRLCFATNNRLKLDEAEAILGEAVELVTLADIGCKEELPETQTTIRGNARQKSKYVWDHYKIPCFADDSGLEVEALGGTPGVDSAHYAGPQRNHGDNIKLLLENMKGFHRRDAQFVTIISLQLPGGEWSFEGIVKGEILEEQRGAGGFGYDPVFLPLGSVKTLGEMTMAEKNKVSHRAIAIRKLVEFLKSKGIQD